MSHFSEKVNYHLSFYKLLLSQIIQKKKKIQVAPYI